MNKKRNVRNITQIGMYAALIALAIYLIRIPMPSAISNTFVHPGNALVILAILFLGFKDGAMAALLGLAIFDITSGYLPVVWMTLLENLLVLIVVEVVYRYVFHYRTSTKTLIAMGIIGALTKIITIFIKYILTQLLLGNPLSAAIAVSLTAMPASLFTGVVTAVLVPLLYWPLKPIFTRYSKSEQ